MDLLLVVGVFLLAVLIVELAGDRAPTVARSGAWRQAVTGMIQEPVAATFARPTPQHTPRIASQARPSVARPVPVAPVAVWPRVALPR